MVENAIEELTRNRCKTHLFLVSMNNVMEFSFSDNLIFDTEELIIYKNKKSDCVKQELKRDFNIDDIFESRINSIQNKCVESAGVVPSFNCNLRCVYCSQSSTDGKKDLDFKSFKIYINEIVQKRLIYSIINQEEPHLDLYFTGGGEPTYNWELFSNCVEYAKKICKTHNISLNLHITTNAYFTNEKALYISKNFSSVMISYDGNNDTNLRNRTGSLPEDIQNIICKNIKSISKNTDVTIRTTLMPSDFKLMREFTENIFNEFKYIKNLDYNPVFPVGRALRLNENKDYDSMNLFLNNYLYLSDRNSENDIKITTPIISAEPTLFGCGGLSIMPSEYWLFPDNKIRTCVDSYGSSVIVGEIQDGEFKYLKVDSDIFTEDILKNSNICNNCIALPVCGYGCPLKRLRDRKNDTDYSKKECDLQRKYWEIILEKLTHKNYYRGWHSRKEINGQSELFYINYIGD